MGEEEEEEEAFIQEVEIPYMVVINNIVNI